MRTIVVRDGAVTWSRLAVGIMSTKGRSGAIATGLGGGCASLSGGISRTARRLVLLVGSNPLPNCLAAVALGARQTVLLHSPETQEPCERLEAVFRARGIDVSKRVIQDATDARQIRDACRSLDAVDHLHYSGGTKPMAAHVRMALQLEEHQASYLDERRGLLRFYDGYNRDLSGLDLGLTLERILELHGIERVAAHNPSMSGVPTEEDASALADRVLRYPSTAKALYCRFRPEGRMRSLIQARGDPWNPADQGLSLSASQVPGDDWSKDRYEAWVEFLTGRWLERWTATQIRGLVGDTCAVQVGVHCKRTKPKPAQFEIDVALIRRQRLYVLSCTTDSKKAQCKSKLFEVAMRARQMGGDLARSALVCLLDGGDDANGPYIDQLRGDIGSLWDAPNVPKAFGLADLREWAGIAGEPNLASLWEWLES